MCRTAAYGGERKEAINGSWLRPTVGRSSEFWRECNGTEVLMSGGCRDEVALPQLARTRLGPTHRHQKPSLPTANPTFDSSKQALITD